MKFGTRSSPWEKIKSTPWWKASSLKPPLSHLRSGFPISARKTLVSKMKKANLERSSIAKVTGHRNIQSLDDYDEADEDEQRQLSWAISKGNSTAKPSTSSGSSTSSAVIPHMMSSQAQNLMNSFTNCTVTFNLNSKTSPVIKPRKRWFNFIKSDSDTDWYRQFLELLSYNLNFFESNCCCHWKRLTFAGFE